MSKKKIIAIVSIIVLLFAAGISVGVFLYGRGETAAANEDETITEGNQVADENQTTDETQTDVTTNEQTGNEEIENEQVTTPAQGDNSIENNNDETADTDNEGTPTVDTDVTTNTDVNEVGETTISRVEEQERLISRDYWDWWKPMEVAITSTDIGVQIPQIVVKKTAMTDVAGDKFIHIGENITYVIAVTNNGETVVENIEITDKIPENTTFVSIEDAIIFNKVEDELVSEKVGTKTTVETEGNVKGVKWIVTIPAGETVFAEFTVNVNKTMIDSEGKEVETTGTILNTAIANGNQSDDGEQTKTAIIKSNKTSKITRLNKENEAYEEVQNAKIGDLITYTITIENTGDIAGKTYILDTIPDGTELITVQDQEVKENQKDIAWSVNIEKQSTITREFTVKVVEINGNIKNIADVGGTPTNEDIVETAKIDVEKTVTDIKREGISIGKDAEVKAEDIIEYKITVTNKGSKDLTKIEVIDKLEGIEVVEGNLIIGDLKAGESKEIIATYTVSYDKDIKDKIDRTIINEVNVSGETLPNPENPDEKVEKVEDKDDITTTVEEKPLIDIEKTATAVNGEQITETTTVRPGDVIEYKIKVDNIGNVTLNNIEITDSLNVKIDETEKDANTVIYTIETLEPNREPVEITVYYTVTETDCAELQKIKNVATVKAGDGTTDNDEDETVEVNPDTTVSITKIWEDGNNQDGKRTSEITINLYADGQYVKSQTISGTTYTFEKLPKYNEQKTEIKYAVTENEVAEYATTYSEDTLVITNTHIPETISLITVTKEWDDNNNQDGIRPDSVSVSLLANGIVERTANATATNNWVISFEELPVYENGNKIEYSIIENNVPEGYTENIVGNVTDGFVVTNTHTPETTEVTATKAWSDNNDQDGIRPDSVNVTLYADGVEVETVEVKAEENWTYTFNNLPKYRDGGVEIIYTVDETQLPTGYTKSVEGNTITNTHIPETTEVTVTKTWSDNNNQDGIRPSSVTVTLYADGTEIETAEVKAEENWTYTFNNLPKYRDGGVEIVYTIDEIDVAKGYIKTIEGYAITNTHTPESTEVTVTKSWSDNNDQDGIRPDSVNVTLYADGVEVETAEVKAEENWTYTFNNLPKYRDGGVEIIYTVDETQLPTGYTKSVEGNTITNTHIPETTEVTVTKAWSDNNNQDGIRPEKVNVTLYADGEVVETVKVKANENWIYTFGNLTKYRDGGVEIVYTVDEIEVPTGYTKSVEGYTVTNTHTPATKSITVNKIWEDNNNQDGIRPQSVNISLLADGTVKETVDILATQGWSYTFENLPEKSNGKTINYTVTENTIVTGYQSVVDGYTITNTHNTEKTSITVTKVWDDNNDQDGIRPDSVELTLYANSIEKQTVTVNAENNWSYTFNELPVNENGIAIQYSVDEKTVPTGYEKTVNGYTVKNTYIPETTEVTVTKTWSDNNNQDGIRTEKVNVTLYADGEVVETAEVKAEENWTYTFNNLPKYRDGGVEIVYTIDETEVPTGYTKSVAGNTITNTHTPETTEVTVTKVWSDNNNQDGIRPEKVNVTLYADGKEIQTAEVKAGENWTYTFNNLPKYRDGGVQIVYTVDEIQLPEGYTKSVEGNTITNTHIPATTQVIVTKTWSDNNNQDGVRPEKVKIALYADGIEVQTAEIVSKNNWSYTFGNLAKYRDGGVEIVYTIDEIDVAKGYIKTIEGYAITNTHTPESTEVTVTKKWSDNNNQDGIRPEKVNVTLYADGKEVKTAEVKASENWTYTFNDLPKYKDGGVEIVYIVDETQLPTGYTKSVSGNTITNTHTPETTEVTVTKEWSDNNNQDGIRPTSVSVSLLANGEVKETVNILESKEWKHTFSNLDKYAAGKVINYTVVENNVKTGYTATITGTAQAGYTITNAHTPEKIQVKVNKVWSDNNNQDGIRPDSINVSLLANGVVKETVNVLASNDWKHTFSNLDKKVNGQDIIYTVEENNVISGYASVVTGDAINGYIITNKHIPEVINIPVTKVWNDNNNHYNARTTVTVDLKVGNTVKQTITISETDGWNKSFTNLPKYQAGQEINYTVSERAVEGYTTSITGDKAGYTITNTYTNVIINKKTLTSTETSEEEENANVDVVFVIDTSSSMQGTNATNMINALNSAMATILENSNNRVGVVGYSDNYYSNDTNSTVLLELNHYTAKGTQNKFFTLSGSGNSTKITSNVTQLTTQTSRYVRGATYTQIGVKEGARLLTQASNTNTTGRTPVIILLTDGEPTRYTTAYSNVANYTHGDGYASSINAEGAYYNIMTARYYKQQVDNKYTDTTAQFYTIGIDMDQYDAYQNALLNPNTANVRRCMNSGWTSKARGIYTLLYNNYRANGGTKTNFNSDLNYYSYADGAYLGEMNETKLNEILTKITTNITKNYATTTTKTTNLNEGVAKVQLMNPDVNEKITIALDGVSQEYEFATLIENGTMTLENGIYHINLKATMFNNVKEIEITYYETSSTN